MRASSGAVLLDVVQPLIVDALRPEIAAPALADYYAVDGGHPGAAFLELGPFDNHDITSGDLVAVAMLGVSLVPRAVRRLLHPGAVRSEITRLLAEDSLSFDDDLRFATPQVLRTMEELHALFSDVLAADDGSLLNAGFGASAFCARKRPDLFPMTERQVLQQLGLAETGQARIELWHVLRDLLNDDSIRDSIDVAEDRARTLAAVQFEGCLRRLRHLDVAVGMHVRSIGLNHTR